MKNEKEEQIIDRYKNQDVEHGTYGLRLSPLSIKWRLPTVGLGRPSGPPISALVLGGTSGPCPQCLSTWLDEAIHACHPVLNVKSREKVLRGQDGPDQMRTLGLDS